MRTISLALAQLRCELANKKMKLLRILQSIEDCGRNGADYILFPELYLTGYVMNEQRRALAEPEDGESQVVHPDGCSIYKAENNEIIPVLSLDMSENNPEKPLLDYLHNRRVSLYQKEMQSI
ncbi:hypothetical protein JQN58_07500 [Aneurinibacillus sp. BA2021]|nr:hypothetical protein [Aneurinibacillus sp. BA2021]